MNRLVQAIRWDRSEGWESRDSLMATGKRPRPLQFLAGTLPAVGIHDAGDRFGVAIEGFVIVNRHLHPIRYERALAIEGGLGHRNACR